MKAAILNSLSGKYGTEVDIDELIGRQVLVEVKAVGLSHTDLQMARNDFGEACLNGKPFQCLRPEETLRTADEVPLTQINEVYEALKGDVIARCVITSF